MKNSLESKLGMFAALAVGAAFVIIEMLGGPEHFMRGYRLYAMFNNVQELKVGDRVKMAGVEEGRVEKIQLDGDKARVTLKMKRDAQVKTDSTAMVKFTGLMGQNFVSLDFGTSVAPLAKDGAILNSKEQPDLSVVMEKIDSVASGVQNMTKSFSGLKIDELLGPFIDFMKDNRAPLTATISNINSVTYQVASGEGTVGKLIYDQALYNSALDTVTNLQATLTDARATVADARNIIEQVNSGQGTAGKLIKDDKLYNETTASMTNLKEILQKINQGQGSVGKLINDQEFYKNAKLTLQKLDKMTDGLEDQGPLSVLGIAVNSLL
ncbi:MAG TPA: MlaD family protein [Verrucomicrobiae bacterium]|jgi:phospholipid/cholesterol/gamma-HCH transport system substrate-binding protein|nr:MlaD family protein [Verrucomicrobiae bacterium]